MRISAGLLALALLTSAAMCSPAGDPPMTPSGFTVAGSVKDAASRWWVMAGDGSYGAAISEFTATYQQKGWDIGVRDANNPDDPGVIARSHDGQKCVSLSEWSINERNALVNAIGLDADIADEADAQPAAFVMTASNSAWFFGAAFPS